MKIYVATSFQNIPEARDVMAALKAAGHSITFDWTHEKIDPAWDVARQERYFQTCGQNDFQGVSDADAVVLVNHTLARDAMAEFGIALGMGKPVLVLYPERRASVFFHRASLCATLEDAVTRLSILEGA